MSDRLINALTEVRTLPHITLGSIVDHIKEEAILILSLISILPFMQPIPIPGLSSLLGIIVFLQGIGLTLWGKPLLTKRLKKINITHEKFELIYKAAVKFSNVTSKISAFKHPITNHRAGQILCGISIIISAGFLALPLPIPFSNFIPAVSIFLICVGLLEEDLMLIIMGLGVTATVIWMAVLSYSLIKGQILQWI